MSDKSTKLMTKNMADQIQNRIKEAREEEKKNKEEQKAKRILEDVDIEPEDLEKASNTKNLTVRSPLENFYKDFNTARLNLRKLSKNGFKVFDKIIEQIEDPEDEDVGFNSRNTGEVVDMIKAIAGVQKDLVKLYEFRKEMQKAEEDEGEENESVDHVIEGTGATINSEGHLVADRATISKLTAAMKLKAKENQEKTKKKSAKKK